MYDLGKGERRGAPVAPVCSFTLSLLDFVFNRGDGVLGAKVCPDTLVDAVPSLHFEVVDTRTPSCSITRERERTANSVVRWP